MKIAGGFSKPLLVHLSLGVGALLGLGMVTLAVQAAQPTQKIEIIINDSEAKVVRGTTLNGVLTEISVRNEDSVTHGFNSSIFEKASKIDMSGGSIATGKGSHVYRVDPGKTLVLKFTLPDQPGGESRTYSFWCDMHHSVKGEMLVVEQTGEVGGG